MKRMRSVRDSPHSRTTGEIKAFPIAPPGLRPAGNEVTPSTEDHTVKIK